MKRKLERAGFTLLELSIVLAIIAVIATGSLTMFTASLQERQWQDTQDKLKAIQTALYNFRLANNRIPCPADVTLATTDPNFGVEAANPGTCTGGTPAANFTGGQSGSVNSASFVKTDTATQGSWGWCLRRRRLDLQADTSSDPAYVSSVNFSGDKCLHLGIWHQRCPCLTDGQQSLQPARRLLVQPHQYSGRRLHHRRKYNQ